MSQPNAYTPWCICWKLPWSQAGNHLQLSSMYLAISSYCWIIRLYRLVRSNFTLRTMSYWKPRILSCPKSEENHVFYSIPAEESHFPEYISALEAGIDVVDGTYFLLKRSWCPWADGMQLASLYSVVIVKNWRLLFAFRRWSTVQSSWYPLSYRTRSNDHLLMLKWKLKPYFSRLWSESIGRECHGFQRRILHLAYASFGKEIRTSGGVIAGVWRAQWHSAELNQWKLLKDTK